MDKVWVMLARIPSRYNKANCKLSKLIQANWSAILANQQASGASPIFLEESKQLYTGYMWAIKWAMRARNPLVSNLYSKADPKT